MTSKPSDTPSTTTPLAKVDFTDEQCQAIVTNARQIVEATVEGQTPKSHLPSQINHAPAFGIFLTLRRTTLLRACRGRWGGDPTGTLGPLLVDVARDTATLDPRFPSITVEELPYLAIDVSLMYEPAQVHATGDQRIAAIQVGRDGLVIDHPRGRGLLLPHVATEAGWDAKTFLDHLALKAGLPADTWRRDPNARLMTFHTRLLTSNPPKPELNLNELGSTRLRQLLDTANCILQGEANRDPEDHLLCKQHDHELGIHLQTESGALATAIASGQSLLALTKAAVRSIQDLLASPSQTEPEAITRLALLWQPIWLKAQDYPSRHMLLGDRAIRIRHNGQWKLALPDNVNRTGTIGQAFMSMQMTERDWPNATVQLTAFSIAHVESRRRPVGLQVRQPARDGQFYPADPGQMNQTIDAHLAASSHRPTKRTYRAVMLPHAGWQFCGDTIGKTLCRINLPESIILIGPKHTPFGATWSISPHDRWNIPGSTIQIATDLVQRLIELVPDLACEPDAHRAEHSSEVLLPFLKRLQPQLQAAPIVMGQTSYEATAAMAHGLAKIIGEMDPAPLLVISSDLNHFAPEPENRRLDHMALDAMLTGDPRQLFDTCCDKQISMCGLYPAVTVMQALAKMQPMELELVDYRNSAAITGDVSNVVGYAGVLIK